MSKEMRDIGEAYEELLADYNRAESRIAALESELARVRGERACPWADDGECGNVNIACGNCLRDPLLCDNRKPPKEATDEAE